MLKYQFTARHKYNRAEKINSLLWIISIITTILAFFPNLEDVSWVKFVLLIIDFAVIVLCCICNYTVQKAANIRAVFDDYVLGFNNIDIDKTKRTRLNETVLKTVQRYDKAAKIQMNNSGNDTPPGVKDWYEFPENFTGQAPILFCQRQNIWWTNKMMIIKSILFAIEVITLIAVVLIVISISDIPSFEKAICLLGFVIKTIDRISATLRYCICYFKIIGALETQDTDSNHSSLIKIQEMINELRAIPILGNNKCHQKLANKLSKCFIETIEE